jgi:hypothetical protein
MRVEYAGTTQGGGGSNVSLPASLVGEHKRTLLSIYFGGAPQNTKSRLLFRNLPPSTNLSFHRPYSLYNIPFVDSTFPAKRSSNIVA